MRFLVIREEYKPWHKFKIIIKSKLLWWNKIRKRKRKEKDLKR